WMQRRIKFVSFHPALRDDLLNIFQWLRQRLIGESKAQSYRTSCRNGPVRVMNASFGSLAGRVDALLTLNDESMKGIFHKGATAFDVRAENSLGMRFIVGKKKLAAGLAIQEPSP